VKKTVLPILIVLLLASSLFAGTGRKVLKKEPPAYPAIAKQMHLTGSVKLEATVASTGKVKEVKVLGGHPLLSQAAADAAKNWQYEPASAETVEMIQVNFSQE
jgi:protein TonB